MIDDQPQLDRLVERLAAEPALAVDCEMDSMYAYGTSLCVVQLGWPGGEALIDGLVDLDRSGLGTLFADARVLKVFHGGENDVGLLRDRWGLHFETVFDTMLASQILGHEGCGLAAVLQRHFGVHVSKKFQKADWRVRPLPDEQAEYARLDVRWLLPLRERLAQEIAARGRDAEAASDFQRMSRACIPERPFDPRNWGRIKGARDLPAARRAALREVFVARDAIARRLDRAPYRVMQEEALVELARRAPARPAELRQVRGINRHLTDADVAELLAAIARGLAEGEIPLPPAENRRRPWDPTAEARLTPAQDRAFDALRDWRQRRAAERGVEISRVATTHLLLSLARALPATSDALALVEGMEPWRCAEYGPEIVAAIGASQAGRDA